MKQARRWLLNLAVAVSAVLCVATAVLWFRSYRAFDEVGLAHWDPGGGDADTSALTVFSIRFQRGVCFFARDYCLGYWEAYYVSAPSIPGRWTRVEWIRSDHPRFPGEHSAISLKHGFSVVIKADDPEGAVFSFLHPNLGPNFAVCRIGIPLWILWLITVVLYIHPFQTAGQGDSWSLPRLWVRSPRDTDSLP
jgi:hypothetical protein